MKQDTVMRWSIAWVALIAFLGMSPTTLAQDRVVNITENRMLYITHGGCRPSAISKNDSDAIEIWLHLNEVRSLYNPSNDLEAFATLPFLEGGTICAKLFDAYVHGQSVQFHLTFSVPYAKAEILPSSSNAAYPPDLIGNFSEKLQGLPSPVQSRFFESAQPSQAFIKPNLTEIPSQPTRTIIVAQMPAPASPSARHRYRGHYPSPDELKYVSVECPLTECAIDMRYVEVVMNAPYRVTVAYMLDSLEKTFNETESQLVRDRIKSGVIEKIGDDASEAELIFVFLEKHWPGSSGRHRDAFFSAKRDRAEIEQNLRTIDALSAQAKQSLFSWTRNPHLDRIYIIGVNSKHLTVRRAALAQLRALDPGNAMTTNLEQMLR